MRRVSKIFPFYPSQSPGRAKRRGGVPLLVWWWGVAIGAILIALFTGIYEVLSLTRITWFLCGGLGIAAIVYFKQRMRLDWLSAPVVYAAVFWGFHFGLVFPAAIIPALLEPLPRWARDWLDTPETQKAVLLSLLFLFCFMLGYFLKGRSGSLDRKQPAIPERSYARELVLGGWICIAIGAIIVVVSLVRLGIGSFLEAYEVFFEINNAFSISIVIISFGLMLQVAGGRPIRIVLIRIVLFLLPIAIPTLLAGARTAPIFSMAVFGAVLAKKGLRIPRLGIVVGTLFLLGLVAVVQETRQVGLSEAFRSRQYTQAASPLSGLIELGGSLRPVYAVVSDVEGFGQDYFYGYTYIYPIYRQFQWIMRMERSDEFTDIGFVATYIGLRYGSIGFSTVAEAFFNGGVLGVIVFALIWGSVLGFLDRRADAPYGLALLSVVFIPMMINIRNSFIYVPAWISMGMVMIGFCRFFLASKVRA